MIAEASSSRRRTQASAISTIERPAPSAIGTSRWTASSTRSSM